MSLNNQGVGPSSHSPSIKAMLDAGVHFGHQTQRWNPKMKPYVYTARGGIHIIDLQRSVLHAKHAADFVKSVAAKGQKILFVGTKKQAAETVKEAALRSGNFYVNKRWLGGMLTNFATIKASIDRLKRIDRMREKGELEYYSKKERSKMEKEYVKLSEFLDGIREMTGTLGAVFLVDLNKEHIAAAEARTLKIPVVAIADTNTDPELVDYPIPGNDDAIRSIKLFSDMVADSYLEGAKIWEEVKRTVVDKSEQEVAPVREARPRRGDNKTQEAPSSGPAVVKVNKGRKLVAAGTADIVEIEMELEQKEQSGTTEDEDTTN